jgi:hypothetical protein
MLFAGAGDDVVRARNGVRDIFIVCGEGIDYATIDDLIDSSFGSGIDCEVVNGVPLLDDADPNSPANDNQPRVKGFAEPGSTVRLYATSDCSGAPAGDEVDSDGDGCDDCAVGTDDFGPLADNRVENDGTDTDSDGACNVGDSDDDNDGILDAADTASLNPDLCADADGDGCDDCTVGTDNFGPLSDNLVANDGANTDGDAACDRPGTLGSPDVYFRLHLPTPRALVFDTFDSEFDTVLEVRPVCGDGGTEIACSADVNALGQSRLSEAVPDLKRAYSDAWNDRALRLEVVLALGETRSSAAVAALAVAYRDAWNDRGLRHAIVSAMAKAHHPLHPIP